MPDGRGPAQLANFLLSMIAAGSALAFGTRFGAPVAMLLFLFVLALGAIVAGALPR